MGFEWIQLHWCPQLST